ncbi:MAG: lytic transglycosylase domain-containing protein [Alphaproteobacteria bacterium]|nr:lytic transglycosylase domain-containing protein [Alphaproteobacteria bacterium]
MSVGMLKAESPKRHAAHQVCAVHAAHHEYHKGIPKHLLTAISKVESGRVDQKTGKVSAHPWTLNVEGIGYVYQSKEEAIAAVRQFRRQGKKSIDVGCMQVNLHHHPKAFRSLEEALDPHKNIEYAARFLSDLKNSHGTWSKAVAHYHSATKELHVPYQRKVLSVWNKERLYNKTPILGMEDLQKSDALMSRRGEGKVVMIPKLRLSVGRSGPQYVRGQEARMQLAAYRERAKNALGQKQERGTPTPTPHTIKIAARTVSLDKFGQLRKRAQALQKKLSTTRAIQG